MKFQKTTYNYETLLEWLNALQIMQVQYTITKRYVDEKRAHIVGVPEYTLIIEEPTEADTRKRFESSSGD